MEELIKRPLFHYVIHVTRYHFQTLNRKKRKKRKKQIRNQDLMYLLT